MLSQNHFISNYAILFKYYQKMSNIRVICYLCRIVSNFSYYPSWKFPSCVVSICASFGFLRNKINIFVIYLFCHFFIFNFVISIIERRIVFYLNFFTSSWKSTSSILTVYWALKTRKPIGGDLTSHVTLDRQTIIVSIFNFSCCVCSNP